MAAILKKFIVFEGIDASGKSTQARHLGVAFRKSGIRVKVTGEPTDLPIGKEIRKILATQSQIPTQSLHLLYAADRLAHLYHQRKGIIPFLQHANRWVICTRYIYSSYVYQSSVRDDDIVYRINEHFPLPQYLFYIDIDPDISFTRLQRRTKQDIFENRVMLKTIYKKYVDILARAQSSDTIAKIVDGTKPIHIIQNEIIAVLNQTSDINIPQHR